MDPQLSEILSFVLKLFPLITIIVVAGVGGTVFSTWLKIKNGYPLQNSWGFPIHPKTDRESAARITLLTNENAQLRAQIGSLGDRLETIERIITDQPNQLSREIESLGASKN